MVFCKLIMLAGEGRACLKCTTQPHLGTEVAYALYDLPVGGVLVISDGEDAHHQTLRERRGKWQLPPLAADMLWAAYVAPQGKVLAKGSADGIWRDHMAASLYTFVQARRVNPEATSALVEADAEAEPLAEQEQGVPAQPDEVTSLAVGDTVQPAVEQALPPTPLDAIVAIDTDMEVPPPDTADATDTVPQSESAVSVQLPLADNADADNLLRYMQDFPPYAPLNDAIAGSQWVLVQQDDSAYLLGVLCDSAAHPTHLCYGVRGQRNRPFRPDAEWLADEGQADENCGYWIVYNQLD